MNRSTRLSSYTALLINLIKRDLNERHTGTVLGALWLLAQPLFMLMLYTVVFSEILKVRFGTEDSNLEFALYAFTGLIAFNALAEVVTRAPALLIERRDLLLNTPLPAGLLPLLPVASSIYIELIAVALLLVALLMRGELYIASVGFYLSWLFLRVLLSISLSYSLAILGVFLRDLKLIMPALLTVLLFISPILYPPQLIPEQWVWLHDWNLLAQLVDGYRKALLQGQFDVATYIQVVAIAMLLLVVAICLFRSLMLRARYVL